MIRTLQQKVVALQQADAAESGDPEAMIKVFAETTITRLITDGGAGDGGCVAGAFGFFRDTGRFAVFDYPAMSPQWRKVNLVCSLDGAGQVVLCRQPIPPIRPDLLALFDVAELEKYMTDEELAGLPGTAGISAEGTR
jgi:hypothetical protein